MSSFLRALQANATLVSSHMSAAAQKDNAEKIQKILDDRHAAEQRIIDQQNRVGLAEQARVYAGRQAVTYRLSVAQMVDARLEAREYELQAQDYLNAAEYSRGQMGSRYSRSGALLAGSALVRTNANKQRAEKGAKRLRRAAEHTVSRGKMLSGITRSSSYKPAYIPLPDAIKQQYVPPFYPASSGGGGGGGGGYWQMGSSGYNTGPGNPFFIPGEGYFGPSAESAKTSAGSGGGGLYDDVGDTLGQQNAFEYGRQSSPYQDASGFDGGLYDDVSDTLGAGFIP